MKQEISHASNLNNTLKRMSAYICFPTEVHRISIHSTTENNPTKRNELLIVMYGLMIKLRPIYVSFYSPQEFLVDGNDDS